MVPRGTVATYGQIAWMAGYPRRPRQVGMVLKGLPEGTELPWHRIVNARGYVPSRGRWWGAMLQIERLRSEGVVVDDLGNWSCFCTYSLRYVLLVSAETLNSRS